ncbi:MAG TPA: ThuA domain-containing protein [Candidatus Sulfotelmatobacter sp.]|jgi:YVTN family beta-propeller protein|nr:ThuA domain-containing protein [Candidatus Sulfotelmatobacter sp.]
MSARRYLLIFLLVIHIASPAFAQQSRFKVLAFYSATAETDHVQFAQTALTFLKERAVTENFTFEATTRWADLNDDNLKTVQLVIWLNESPTGPEQRQAFERYMQRGGAWLGFHAAGYNDERTNWPWYVDFLGGAVFHINSWPPLPARILLDDRSHPIAVGIPDAFESPANEWYVWKPSPRLDKDVKVLATFDPANYPIGLKDVLSSGDLPVVWTNTKYKMLYMNMGHGDKIFTSPVQNRLIDNAVNWLGTGAQPGITPEASGIQISPRGIVLNPRTHKVYAVNTRQGTVTVFDREGHIAASVQVGARPVSIAVNADTNRIYVANSGDGTVTVLDAKTDAPVAKVAVGELPYVVAVNPANDKVYVARTFSNVMTVIDGKTNATSSLKPGAQADAIAVNAATNKLYLVVYESTNVTVLDATDNRISEVPAEMHLWAIATNSANNKVYATSVGSSNVVVLDGEFKKSTLVPTGGIPCALAIDSSTGRVYVANNTGNSVTVIDGTNNSVIRTIEVGERPQGLAVDSGNHKVYAANTHSGTTTVIDGSTNSVVATLPTGAWPTAIVVDSDTHKAYVSSLGGDQLTVIDGTTLTVFTPTPKQ